MPEENNAKKWYLSKTIWFNLISAIAAILAYYGFELSPEEIGMIAYFLVIVGNLILRAVTKEAVIL